jgi:type II restriction/modification system DNA methylase subunit YeeA
VVVTNPPYLGGKNMNSRLKVFAEDNYPMSKSDLFAMFIERCAKMCVRNGYVSMVTMQSWMFLSSFEDLRKWIIGEKTILSMAHLGARAFDTIGGELVSTTAFCLLNGFVADYRGGFIRLVDGQNEDEKSRMLQEALCGQAQDDM